MDERLDRPARQRPRGSARPPERTCVGCGNADDAGAMVRLVVSDDEVAFDLAGSAFGRGAHVHPRPECIARAPRGLSRSLRREVRTSARALGEALVAAADRRMGGLLVAARRQGALAAGAAAAKEAMAADAPLVLVACDAGAVASTVEVGRMVSAGRAIAWSDRDTLGALLGGQQSGGAVAICAVLHRSIAEELKKTRAAADAGAAAAKDGARWNLSPEAR